MPTWTIGHSTLPFETFARLLATHGIEQVADIRRVPRSSRQPHFNSDALARTLPERGVGYRHFPSLGGWRRPTADSPNGAWRNTSFRAYADYAMTDDFAGSLAELRELAAERRTIMMCSEALWWRCHRRLVADHLVVAGETVLHISSDGGTSTHSLPPFARLGVDGQLTYPPA
jgi:uncharacterized protein (DUF488 family)